MSAIHVDARSWRDNWEEIGSLPSGGQGTSKIGRRRDGTVDRAFIKILNRQNVAERRARLYREAVSLETLVALGIPVYSKPMPGGMMTRIIISML